MEGRTLVTKTVLASRELTEVLRGLRDDVVEEPEGDTARGRVVDGDIELDAQKEQRRKKVA